MNRRSFLAGAGLLGAGLAVGGATGFEVEQLRSQGGAVDGGAVPFYGQHQTGVTDRAPAHLRFAALDLSPSTSTAAARDALRTALQRLTTAGAAIASGAWRASQDEVTLGLRPQPLTVTVGLGAGALSASGFDVPSAAAPLPAFAQDELDPARSHGDIGIQVCGEDAHLTASAAAALVIELAGIATPRWTQSGFLPSAAGSTQPGATRRNLMGQIDGTDNPTGAALDSAVWIDKSGSPDWMRGGTYLVCRRIRMLLPAWQRLDTASQEKVIGRSKSTGAPLSGGSEHTAPNFTAVTVGGAPAIATNAHVRLTHPSNNGGKAMLRRGYGYDEGYDSAGTAQAGLFFQAFQTDPQTVFVPIQLKLAGLDALTSFIRHESSSVFAVLPGVERGGWLGQELLG